MTVTAISGSEFEALASFLAAAFPGKVSRGGIPRPNDTALPYVDVNDTRYVLAASPLGENIDKTLATLRSIPRNTYEAEGLSGVIFALKGWPATVGTKGLGIGVRAMSLGDAVASVIGLPDGWRLDQSKVVVKMLLPLEDLNAQPVPMRGRAGSETVEDALNWLMEHLLSNASARVGVGSLFFIRAEAGKGKSTLLATATRNMAEAGTLPIPLLIPLRELASGRGVSWEEILRTVGISGIQASRAALAVRHGLLLPILDGLDEVAGRYDPQLVRNLLGIIADQLAGTAARVVLSGRTTEAAQIDSEKWTELELELPDPSSEAFAEYVSVTVSNTASAWPEFALQLPEELRTELDITDIPEQTTPAQAEAIRLWVSEVFEDFGKDRSLFFVQSLAGIARNRQHSGNKPLMVPGSTQPPWRPSIQDVCTLAAAMACVREQGKIEPLARSSYTSDRQLRLLSGLALRSSVEASLRMRLPNANELTRDIFEVDPVNNNELFTAILRQNQKHALLYSQSDSLTVGDWRPDFLSAWMRNALLVWAWLHPEALPGVSATDVREAVARSQQARLAFSDLFPALLDGPGIKALAGLANELIRQSAQGSIDAGTSHWLLWVALPAECRTNIAHPTGIPSGADLTAVDFTGIDFDARFSGSMFLLNGATFEDCSLKGSTFSDVDFTGVRFLRCKLEDAKFERCDGPIVFEDCEFVRTHFLNTRARKEVPLTFTECVFAEGSRIEQTDSPALDNQARPTVHFIGCTSSIPSGDLLSGEWLGLQPQHANGLDAEVPDASLAPWEVCLRSMLRPFFPRRAGAVGQIQARRYIRLSALGRGRFPPNTPSPSDLRVVLEHAGFNTGGRAEHLYAPWASINGAPQPAIRLRNELATYLRDGQRSPAIEKMLSELKRHWD